MVIALKRQDVPDAGEFIRTETAVPFHDGTADVQTFVWAVYRSSKFNRKWRVGIVQYHASLGWRPDGSTSWDWDVAGWRYLSELPDWAADENRAEGYADD